MLIHKFYKENGKWYIDIPELCLPKDQTEIIEGGKILLEKLSEGQSSIQVQHSVFSVPNGTRLVYEREDENGATYLYEKDLNSPIPLRFCDNIKRLFGHYPLVIYFKKVN